MSNWSEILDKSLDKEPYFCFVNLFLLALFYPWIEAFIRTIKSEKKKSDKSGNNHKTTGD